MKCMMHIFTVLKDSLVLGVRVDGNKPLHIY